MRKYIPFSIEDAKALAKSGEELESKGFVKTEGFEKSIVLWMEMTKEIYRMMSENKSFRMELIYDANALNVNYCFFSKNESDDRNPEY